jgi:type II secretory ATPase GspE/PulE/Tfp pilus assembly ATPase PilB-like protein
VYLSIPADGAMAALQTYLRAVGDPNLAGEGLRGVIAGKLLRKLCVNCRVAYPPAPDQLKALGLPADRVKQLYKKGGQVLIKNKPEVCPVCNGIGYVGQEGIFEVFPLGAEERSLIKKGDFAGLQVELRKKQYPSISQAAKRKLVDGLTSIEELQRVSTSAKPAARPQPAKPQPTA